MITTRKISLLMANDMVLAMAALPAAFLLRFNEAPSMNSLSQMGGLRVAIFVFTLVFVSFFVEIYKYQRDVILGIAFRILLSIGLSFLILSAIYYSIPFSMYGRGELAVALTTFGILQFACHSCYCVCGRLRGFSKRVLIVGTGPLASKMGEMIPATRNYVLSGYVRCSDEPAKVPSETIFKTDGNLLEMVRREKPDKIVVSLSERRGVFPLQEIMACKLSGIEVQDAPSFYEEMTGKLLLENITPSWFIFSDGFRITLLTRTLKRAGDLIVSALGILLALPLFPFIVLAIKLDSPGPVLFRQVRVGEREKNFVLYKFRTMRVDAENGTGAVWAQEKDPRVTRIGAFFRKSRIDEIPQLFNVLKGDMSMVGPRPERPEFVDKLKVLIPFYSERHVVKPGATGWAQIRYSYGASVEDALEKLRYDLYYVKNLSLYLDVMIIIETIKVVLFRRGGR